MENIDERFTNKVTGAAFLEEIGGENNFTIRQKKNGVLFYQTTSAKYPQGYISKAAADIFKEERAKDSSSSAKKSAILMMSFADIITDDGEAVPTIYPTPEEPEVFW